MGLGIVVIVIIGAYGILVAMTGFTVPFSSVVSESMQHDNDRSNIGTIDTGDIVIVAQPNESNITSYVMGTQNGYKSFGEYGSVIIYERDANKNPVIHRAMVWLDYNENTGTWSSKELMNYTGEWYYKTGSGHKGNDFNNIQGTLYFEDMSGKDVSINLDNLYEKKSGYLTMGDNPVTNRSFDQSAGIVNHLIGMEDIRSVAIAEIPWLGIPKLIMNNNSHLSHVPNSLPSLIMGIILLFSAILIIDLLSVYKFHKNTEKTLISIKGWKKV